MNLSRLKRAAAAAAALALTLACASLLPGHGTVFAAQDPAPQAPPPGARPHHEMPNPTNLQVLPKNLTGDQVHEIMEKWEGELGTNCRTCHVTDPNRKMPNGRPAMNFADDSKDDKKTARLMFKMVQDINTNYVSKVPNSGAPVSCGTCHRGHLGPEPFVPAPEEEHAH